MYSELPFATAQCLIEVPYNLAQAFLFSLISYFMLGFDHDAGEPQSFFVDCLSIGSVHSPGCFVLLLSFCCSFMLLHPCQRLHHTLLLISAAV